MRYRIRKEIADIKPDYCEYYVERFTFDQWITEKLFFRLETAKMYINSLINGEEIIEEYEIPHYLDSEHEAAVNYEIPD